MTTEPAPLRSEIAFSVVPEWITFHPDLSGNDVRLYAVLCRFADSATHRAFPGQTLLAQRARMSERGVRDAVDRLEEAGALVCRRRWKDQRDRIYYESGTGRTQTSSEYVLRVVPPQGVAATNTGTWRQQLPTNENHQGTTSAASVAATPQRRTKGSVNAERAAQDRMKGGIDPRARWSEEQQAWVIPQEATK